MTLGIDVSRVVKNPKLQQPFTIQRNTYAFANEGEWTLVTALTLAAKAVIIATSEKDRAEYLSEGQRQSNAITLYCPTPINKADGNSLESDIILWRGGYYRVQFSKPYDPYGYWFAIATGFVAPDDVIVTPPPSGGGGGGGSADMPSLVYHKVAGASTNVATIKASPGTVIGWKIYNNAPYPVYIKLFNKAGTPVLGSDMPQQTIGVDAGMTAELAISGGLSYSAGIGVAVTKNLADADATAVAAGDCVMDIFYQ